MKIIALSCSPSKGRNSDSMLDSFINGMNGINGIEIEKIYLEDIKINNYSYENRMGTEDNEPEFKDLCDKVQNADGLVIATPTYNFSVPANLKNFIDRIRFFALDLENKNKMGQPVGKLKNLKLYYLVSGGTPKWAQKILFFAFPPFWLRSVFLYYGSNCMGAFYSGDVNTLNNQKILNKCKNLGKKYASQILKGKCHGVLERVFWRPPQVD